MSAKICDTDTEVDPLSLSYRPPGSPFLSSRRSPAKRIAGPPRLTSAAAHPPYPR